MTARRPWTIVAAIIFLLMALVHLYRLAAPFEMTSACHVPQSASIIGLIVAGALARCCCASSVIDVEAEQQDVAVLNDIFLAFGAHLAGVLGAGFAAAGDEIVDRRWFRRG